MPEIASNMLPHQPPGRRKKVKEGRKEGRKEDTIGMNNCCRSCPSIHPTSLARNSAGCAVGPLAYSKVFFVAVLHVLLSNAPSADWTLEWSNRGKTAATVRATQTIGKPEGARNPSTPWDPKKMKKSCLPAAIAHHPVFVLRRGNTVALATATITMRTVVVLSESTRFPCVDFLSCAHVFFFFFFFPPFFSGARGRRLRGSAVPRRPCCLWGPWRRRGRR